MGHHQAQFTYHDAHAFLGGKDRRPLPDIRSTDLRQLDGGAIALRYHSTDVITYYPDGRMILRAGGWYSPTTKQRIGDFGGIQLYADRGEWFVSHAGQRYAFVEGLEIGPDGAPTNAPPAPDRRKVKREIDRVVKAYIAGFAAHVVAHGLQAPNGGDCWGCLMQVKDAAPVQQGEYRRQAPTPHGRVEPMGLDHYVEHFRDGYYVPSLLANAITGAGYRDPGFIWALITADGQRGRTDMLERVLRAYFRRMKPALLEVWPVEGIGGGQ